MREHILEVTVINKHNQDSDCHHDVNVVTFVDCADIVITTDLNNLCVVYIIVNDITSIEFDNRRQHTTSIIDASFSDCEDNPSFVITKVTRDIIRDNQQKTYTR